MTASARHHSLRRPIDTPLTDPFGARFGSVELVQTGPRFLRYDAVDPRTGRRVSLKVPADEHTPWTAAALRTEAAVLGAVGGHPHVLTLFEQVTLADGRPALCLERCAGSFGDLTGNYVPALRTVVAIGIKLCGALETLHRRGFVHADVRPANILVSEWGEPLLANFDEATRIETPAPEHPLHAPTSHTAPELLEGGKATERSDVYGLAVTLYELVAGHAAFPAYRGERQSETSLRILRGVRLPLPAHVPIEFGDLIGWALSADPAERIPGPAWLAEELQRLEHQQDWPRTPRVIGP